MFEKNMSVKTTEDGTFASGFDEVSAVVGGLSSLLFGGLTVLVLPLAWGSALLVLMGLTLLSVGCRYTVHVSPSGIRLRIYRGWFFPIYRREYLLDCDIDLYQSFSADAPEGICIREPYPDVGLETESECFACLLHTKRIEALQEDLAIALERCRDAVRSAKTNHALRHRWLGPQIAALDLDRAKRDENGRIRAVISKAHLTLGGIKIPRGSTFLFNEARFLDPRRDDRLWKVILGDNTQIAGLEARRGGSLIFDPSARLSSVRGAFSEEIEVEGNLVDGRDIIAFDENGKLQSFTLARRGYAGGYPIPQGSRLTRWRKDKILPERWTCWLGGPLELPEVNLAAGESIELSSDGKQITGFSPRKDIKIGALTLKSGIMSIPLKNDGRVDLAKCRKMGLVAMSEDAAA